MGTVLLIAILMILVVGQIIILLSTVMFIYGNIISSVPLVPVRRNALNKILEALALSDGDKLYDLGSGDGRVLAYALEAEPKITAIGLEIGPWPRMLSKIKLRKYGSRVKIVNKDFFKANISDATHIYVYLYPKVLEKLKMVFDKNLLPGTRVVSCDFPFINKQPEKIIPVPNSKTISKTLYVYIW